MAKRINVRSRKPTSAARKSAGGRRTAKRTGAAKGTKRAPRKPKPAPIPAGYRTVTPYLVCRGAADALAFYTRAFGAKERVRMAGPDGRIAHAEIRIGDSMLMLGDEMPEMGASAPPTFGGTPVQIFLYVKDVDKAFARATSAGATAEMPPTDMFWGDRYCKLADPFGHKWSIATHIEDVSAKEMRRRSQEAFAQQPGQPAGGG